MVDAEKGVEMRADAHGGDAKGEITAYGVSVVRTGRGGSDVGEGGSGSGGGVLVVVGESDSGSVAVMVEAAGQSVSPGKCRLPAVYAVAA